LSGTIERGAFSLFLSNFVFFISSYLVYFALGRLLGEASFGVYGIVISLVTIINMVLMTAMEQTVSKFVSEKPEQHERIKKAALMLHLSISSLIFIAFLLFTPMIALLLNDVSLTPFIYLISPLILLHPLFRIFSGVLNGLKKFSLQAKLVGVYSIAKVVLIVGLVLLGFGLGGAISGFVLSSVLVVIAAFFVVGLDISKKPVNQAKMIAFALPIGGLAVITNLLMSLDLFAVKAFTEPSISSTLAGYYTAAGTVAKVIPTLVIAISFVAFPLVSGASFKKDSKKTGFYISNALRYSLLAIGFMACLFSVTASELLEFVYGARYAPAAIPLEVLAFGLGAFALFSIFVTIISAAGKPKTAFLVGNVVLLADIVLNFIFVPSHGMLGAAIATTAASFFGLIISGLFVKARLGSFVALKTIARVFLAGAAIFAVADFLPGTGLLLPFKYFTLLVVYLGVLLGLRELKHFDFLVLKNVLRK